MTSTTLTRLSRASGHGRPAAPVRIVHLGVGNFFRAHQAWYTEHAPDAAEWGIAAFTGRSAAMADALRPQDGLYTLITRGADGDSYEVVSSLSAVHSSSEHEAFLAYLRSPGLAIVTLTVTEAGYVPGTDGHLDLSNPGIASDIETLRADPHAPVTSMPGRLVAGLIGRRAAFAGPLAIVSCDNLSHNGEVLETVVTDLAAEVDPHLVGWIGANVAFGTTMVDRITPATTDAHRASVLAATGTLDEAPVPTEPFSEWVIQGEFPNGRPAWEAAGARIVADVEPFERRKLALLNGSHSLLAYGATILGHETVADAIADPRCQAWVEQWWDEACAHLPLPAGELAAYRQALLERYRNPNIRHALAQIAADGSLKIAVRILPTLRAELAAGRVPPGAARAVAAWVQHLRGLGAPVKDVSASEILALAQGTLEDTVTAVLGYLDPDLAADEALRAAVLAEATDLAGLTDH
ncbi:MAG TPA: mannitol dehydrogenase family protein [Propionicimonas sp.]|uniref:mannitol dehydrogenase family protein n=1 Tax=Propionicimonas sp. TaxID=1955623 RepID=UPI002F42F726